MKRKPTSTAGRLAMAVAAILIISAQIVSAQDFTVQMKDEDGKIIATHYVSRNAVRNVSSYPVDTDMIYRLDTGKIITVNHKQKTYGEITVAEVRQLLEKKQAEMNPQKQELMRHFGFGGAATVIQGITSFSLTQLLSKAAQRLIAELRQKVQAHVGRLPVSFHDSTIRPKVECWSHAS